MFKPGVSELGDYSHAERRKRPNLGRTDLIPRHKGRALTVEAAEHRRQWLETKAGHELPNIRKGALVPEAFTGNIENFIGTAQIPIGVAGPLFVNGEYASGHFYVPLATTEGTLVYTYNHGMLLTALAGGITTVVLKDEIHIAPTFVFCEVAQAQIFVNRISGQFEALKEVAERTSRHCRLLRIEPQVFNRECAVKFVYSTGDAMGINMITIATEAACSWILSRFQVEQYYITSNYSSIKKVSGHQFVQGFGKTVVAESIISATLLQRLAGVTPEEVAAYYRSVLLATSHAAMVGINGQSANAIQALFVACGQDLGCIVESSLCMLNLDVTARGELYASVYMPCLTVGTVGGGTSLPTQRECLQLLGCAGEGQARKFAEIVTATVLAGEVAIASSIAHGRFTEAHKKYGRKAKS